MLLAAEALGSGATVKKAAEIAKVAESSVYRWKLLEDFKRKVDQVTAARLEHYRGIRLRITGHALLTVLDILKDKGLPAALRFRAARPFLPSAIDIDAIADSELEDADVAFFEKYADLDKYEGETN